MKTAVIFIILFLTFTFAYCEDTTNNSSKNWIVIISLTASITTILAFLLALFLWIIPAKNKKIERAKRQKNLRKKIKLYIDKIAKSYRGKIKVFEPEWKKHKERKILPVQIPPSDFDDFNNLKYFSNEAAVLLTEEEKDLLHALHETFEKEKYNYPGGGMY